MERGLAEPRIQRQNPREDVPSRGAGGQGERTGQAFGQNDSGFCGDETGSRKKLLQQAGQETEM